MTVTTKWFQEVHKEHHSLGMTIKEVHYHKRSDYQDILIFENELYGTVMVLDEGLNPKLRTNFALG